jgi:hypothetical protein
VEESDQNFLNQYSRLIESHLIDSSKDTKAGVIFLSQTKKSREEIGAAEKKIGNGSYMETSKQGAPAHCISLASCVRLISISLI